MPPLTTTFIILLATLTTITMATTDFKTEDSVLVLTTADYDKAVEEIEYLLVEFYAPWCGHCKALAPEYSSAASTLSTTHPNIKLAKVDATEESSLAESHSIRGYPTLKFYKNGKPSDYNGGRTASEIIAWLIKKTGPAAKTLTTESEITEFIDLPQVSVIGYFKDENSENAVNYLKTASQIDDIPFGIVINGDGDKVVLHKKFDEEVNELEGGFEEEKIVKFVKTNSLPLIVDFNHETAQKVFGGEIKSHVLMFLSKDGGDYEKSLGGMRGVAGGYREKVLFVSINTDDEDHGRILEFFGMKPSEVPAARVIRLAEEMAKYKPEGNVLEDPEEMKKFVDAFLEGKLKQHLLSQELPSDWNSTPVKTLVASNFDSVVFDTEKSVLVEFYAPWCGHCKQLAPIYEKLGEKFESDESVVITKIDATVNELEHTKINSFPTIKLYKKGDNKVIDYSGPRTLEALENFLLGKDTDEGVKAEEEDEDDDTPKKDEL